jgi:hypothetical protein
VTLPSRANAPALPPPSGERPRPAPAPAAPNVRTPNPQPGRAASVPNRASFQLPGLDEGKESGSRSKVGAKSAPGRPVPPPLPTRGTTNKPTPKAAAKPEAELGEEAWAEEVPERKFGAVGIIAAALLIMVVVYFGATLLMK